MTQTLAILGGARVRSAAWPAWPQHGEPERAALARVLESGNWGGFPSPNTEARRFAASFAQFCGTPFAVPCANGTVSLTLALQAAGVPAGSEVVTTPYTFVGTASAIVAAGCVPVFADISLRDYCLDPDAVESAINARTSAVIPVHLGCSLADLERFRSLCDRRGLILVEDCAHAHGARFGDRAAGSIGDFGSFSLQSTKLLTAGEGGVVVTSDPLWEQRLQSLVNCGRKEIGYAEFPGQVLGHNARMTEWQAAIGSAQLQRFPAQQERRRENVAYFEASLEGFAGLGFLPVDPRVSARPLYQIILRYDADAFAGAARDAVIAALNAEGIPCCGDFYEPLVPRSLFALDPNTNAAARTGVDYASQRFPNAERAAFQEAVWFPHPVFLGDRSDIDDVLKALRKVRDQASRLLDWERSA